MLPRTTSIGLGLAGRIAVVASVALTSAGCPSAHQRHLSPNWTASSVDFGAGRIRVGVRFRWVAVPDETGARIKTPERGHAVVRVFDCGKQLETVKRMIRHQLRSRLLQSEFVEHDGGRVFAWRWRTRTSRGVDSDRPIRYQVHWTAVARHGPLLIAVSSTTIQLEDLAEVAARTRLDLPIPTISSCLPLCSEDTPRCVAHDSEE